MMERTRCAMYIVFSMDLTRGLGVVAVSSSFLRGYIFKYSIIPKE